MTDDEYRAFLNVLFRKYVRPRLSQLDRRFDHPMGDGWRYHLNQAERAGRVLRYIEYYCDDNRDAYFTFTVDTLASTVSDTLYSLSFNNEIIEEAGFLDAYAAHEREILAGLRPEHLPEGDKEVLRDMGSQDPDAELIEIVLRTRARCEHAIRTSNEVSVRQQLNSIKEQVANAERDFGELREAKSDEPSMKSLKKPRRWFKGLGQIAQGAALSIANVALALGTLNLPVSPETKTWGAFASVATGIGAVLSGAGDLRGE